MQKLIILIALSTASISQAQSAYESCMVQSLVAEGIAKMRDQNIPLTTAIQYYDTHNSTEVDQLFGIILSAAGQAIYSSDWSASKVQSTYFDSCIK